MMLNEQAWCVRFVSPGNASLEQFEPPSQVGPGQVRLRALFSLVSTGTELAFLTGKHHQVRSGEIPFPMSARGSYSFVGEVVELGPGVEDVRLGQRLLTMNGHASEAVADVSAAIPVPDALTAAQASFGIVGSIALHGVRMAEVAIGHSVAVTGQGLIGQLTGQVARLAGATAVLATDVSLERLAVAETWGAVVHQAGTTPLPEALAGPLKKSFPTGISVAIETSGSPIALAELIRAVANEATIALLGCPHAPVELDLYTDFQKHQLRLVGAYQPCCPMAPTAAYPWSQHINRKQILDWIASGALDVDILLNDVVAPPDVGGLYQRLMQQGYSIAGGIDWSSWRTKRAAPCRSSTMMSAPA